MRKCSQMIALFLTVIVAVSSFAHPVRAQTSPPQRQTESYDVRELTPPASELRGVIERYNVDRSSLGRSYPVSSSPAREARFRELYIGLLTSLEKLDFDRLGHDDQVDYLIFKNHLDPECGSWTFRRSSLRRLNH